MSVNISSSTNDSAPQFPSTNTCLNVSCFDTWYIYTALSFTSIVLLLPLSVLVLHLGFQRWKQQRSTGVIMSNSDFFTYNMAIIELIGVLMYVMSICRYFICLPEISWVGVYIMSYLWYGQMLFPVMTCVDRYLAVVHPITYLRLRQGVRVHIRNISTVSVWLMGFGGIGFVFLLLEYPDYNFISSACQTVLFLTIMLFCSLSVLRVLIRPRPGEVGGDRVRIHQSKQRAFRTIVIITGVLMLKFGGNLVCDVVISTPTAHYNVHCVLIAFRGWFSLPSSLVLPLLFLHRAGKLPRCKHHTESG